VRVGPGTGAIRLDGLFDEPGWAAAESMSALTMIEPSEGVAPTFATTVAGPRQALRPSSSVWPVTMTPIRSSASRNSATARSGNEDNIKIVLDTFLDGRSGYVFQVNPSGARYDALINREATARTATGMASGCRDAPRRERMVGRALDSDADADVRAGTDVVALNIERRIQRLQETNRWASPKRDWKLTQRAVPGSSQTCPRSRRGVVSPYGRH